MNVLALALLLPSVFWDGAPDTAPVLRAAHIEHILVPPSMAEAWKGVAGISVEIADPTAAVKLTTPRVNYRINEASASSEPWIDANGWKLLRHPEARYYYEAPGAVSALAASEAFAYGSDAMVHTNAAGLKPLGEMLEFLKGLDTGRLPVLANIGFIDDGSSASGELMNLLVRRNLLFNLVSPSSPPLDVTVLLGSQRYPKAAAADPSALAHAIRSDLTDDKRLVRIYGSDVVIARLTGTASRVRLQLLNYAAASRPVLGLRVRVLGKYAQRRITASGIPDAALLDVSDSPGALEFTLAKLKTYAVIDLYR